MGWLDRVGANPPAAAAKNETAAPRDRSSPALAALFESLGRTGARSILDLGQPTPRHLHVLAAYARRIRFAGLVPKPADLSQEAWAEELLGVPPDAAHAYDVVLGWDFMDRLAPSSRAPVMARLAEMSAPGARLYLVVDASDAGRLRPFRFALVDPGRVMQEAVGPPEPRAPQLLPAQVERVLAPFRIQHAYTLRSGQREYVAVRP